MLGHASLLSEQPITHLQVEADQASLSQNVASQRSSRFLWTGVGFAVLVLIALSACALAPLVSRASAKPSPFIPELAYSPVLHGFTPAGGVRSARLPGSAGARTTGIRPSVLQPEGKQRQPLAALYMGVTTGTADEARINIARRAVLTGALAVPMLASLPSVAAPPSDTVRVPSVKLNNGVEMPIMSLGVNIWDAGTCKRATADALRVGIRNIWSSELVGAACQSAQAQAIKESDVPRSELFLAGTVNSASCSTPTDCYTMTKSRAEAQYQVLGVEVLDMLMLDYPPRFGGCAAILGQWKAFEELYAAKKVRSIAVSNFSPDQLQCILKDPSATVPVANQMSFSVGQGGSTVVEDNAKLGIIMQAYSPLSRGGVSGDALCKRIGVAYGKTAAQVGLRWIIQRGGTVNVASKKLEHLRENNEIFDFRLSEDEMKQLNAVGQSR